MKITISEHAAIPKRAHKYDAGLDLCSTEDAEIPPYSFITVGTGVSVELPIGTVGLLTSKSGLMAKQGITTRGTIDCGYTGEIRVTLFNHSGKWRYIEKGAKGITTRRAACFAADCRNCGQARRDGKRVQRLWLNRKINQGAKRRFGFW